MRDRLLDMIDYVQNGKEDVAFDRNFRKELADYLLANGVIVPPCKVGKIVWDNDFGRPCSYIVTGFDIGKTLDDEENHREMFMYYENHNGSVQCNCPITQFGKTVFLTREEAEQALRKEDDGK